MTGGYVLAIDQGTTSSRAVIFDADQRVVALAQREFPQIYPHPGWVEHDPEAIWQSVVSTCRDALSRAQLEASDIAAIGITNQRETVVAWDRRSGRAVHNAIVWQDRRTAEACSVLREAGHEDVIKRRTGLVVDPYFSATKAAWIIANVPAAGELAASGNLAIGTVDSFLVWRLTGGRVFLTDATNAARTMLFDIHRAEWDHELLELFAIPRASLGEVTDCAGDFGTSEPDLFGGAIRIGGLAGDQQAATLGQACFSPGMMKSTYGTGCFALLNTGAEAVSSKNRLLTTIAYQLGGERIYALEGSIFVAGAAVQWLRDELGLIDAAAESGVLAAAADPDQAVYLVPAFVGLGAPYWDAEARGAMFGLTRGTGKAELARAALESVCYQTRDLMEAMRGDWPGLATGAPALRVDGGMVASDWTMQRLADVVGAPVERPDVLVTTALGAAWLAGHHAGVWPDRDGFAAAWRAERRFDPAFDEARRERAYAGWRDAVSRTLSRR